MRINAIGSNSACSHNIKPNKKVQTNAPAFKGSYSVGTGEVIKKVAETSCIGGGLLGALTAAGALLCGFLISLEDERCQKMSTEEFDSYFDDRIKMNHTYG